MKKIFYSILRMVAILALPGLFFGVNMFALNQTLAIGLIILLASIAAQAMFAAKIKNLRWNYHNSLSFRNYKRKERFDKWVNLLFNLNKVLTILSVLYFMVTRIAVAQIFSSVVIALVIASVILSSLAFFFFAKKGAYETIRAILAIIVIFLTLSFVYLYFGTQAIWLLAVLIFAFSLLLNSCEEIEDVLSMREDMFGLVSTVALLVVGLISTVIQFWNNIATFVCMIVTSFLSWQVFGIHVWIILISVILFFIIVSIFKYILRKKAEKKADLKKQEDDEKAKIARKKEVEEQQAKQKTAEAERLTKITERMKSLESVGSFSDVDLVFIANNFDSDIVLNSKIDPKLFTQVNLFTLFATISDVKQKLFYEPSLVKVLSLYGALYGRSKNDEFLDGLIKVIDKLIESINYKGTYTGSDGLLKVIERECKNFPRFEDN